MTTITDFLLARIAEDEAVAQKACSGHRSRKWHLGDYDETVLWFAPSSPEKIALVREKFGNALADEHSRWAGQTIEIAGDDVAPHIVRHDPARVLAECEAKRRIVEEHQVWQPTGYRFTDGRQIEVCTVDEQNWPCRTIKPLAAIWSDHADYDEAWR